MATDASPEDIITSEGAFLGRFIAGHGYWVTEMNLPTVEKVLADGRAKEVDPDTAPLVGAGLGKISGSVVVDHWEVK